MAISPFIGQDLKSVIQEEPHTTIEQHAELLESAAVIPVSDRTTGLPGVPDAIRDLEIGQVRGKIAISLPNRE